jgi:hypothetical protein
VISVVYDLGRTAIKVLHEHPINFMLLVADRIVLMNLLDCWMRPNRNVCHLTDAMFRGSKVNYNMLVYICLSFTVDGR